MAKHVQGISITIRAFLPTGATLDEQFNALSLVKDAHASGDYSKVLASAKIDDVKAEQKTRRVEDQPQATEETKAGTDDDGQDETEQVEQPELIDAGQDDENVPAFLKKGKKTA